MTLDDLEARLVESDRLDQASLLGWLIAAVDEATWQEAIAHVARAGEASGKPAAKD